MDKTYRFGQLEFRPGQRSLRVGGVDSGLGAKAVDLLLALVQGNGGLCAKRALLDRVWPGAVVEDNNLAVQIANLRRVLGPAAITTVNGLGYRFCLPIAIEPSVPPDRAGALSLPTNPPAHPPLPASIPLPLPLTRFIGFEAERAAGAALLSTRRLLTLTGLGGAGKTRLAIEIARAVQAGFAQGVCFIDLATLTDPQGLALTVATALGLRETAGLPAEALLSRHLATWQGLLLLDNCEHLLVACAALVARLLDLAPRLQVLATSRESLGLPGEQVVAMRPMRLPTGGGGSDLLGVEAVDLFVSQALLVAPDFELTPANAQAVVEICQRLDGIPLALELAAARVGLLTVEQIRDRLGDRFRLLTRASKSPSRHQTLLATLQWSHDHLDAAEQRLLADLSVFSGGCTLAAALGVAGAGDEFAVSDLLRQLVDKSLVMADRSAHGEPRYRLLETVRHFAQDQLQGVSGAANALRARHLAYFLDFAQTQDREFAGPGVKQAVARLDAERGNLLTAQDWCAQADEGVDQGLDLANAQRRHWIVSGHYLQGRRSLGQALARAPAGLRSARRGLALFGLGQLCLFSGQLGQACQHAQQALAIGRELGDPRLLVIALDLDRALRQRCCDLAGARRSCHEAVAIAQTLDDPYLLAIALLALGAQQREEGDYPAALLAFQRSRALLKSIGNLTNIAIPARDLAALYTVTGEWVLARAALVETLELTPLSGSNHRAEQTLGVAARLAAMVGDGPLAARIQGALDQYSEAIGAVEVATEPHLAALVDQPRSLLGDEAYALHHQAGRLLSLDMAMAEILAWLKDPAGQLGFATPVLIQADVFRRPLPAGDMLSPRELQVLDLVARGFTYAEIAQRLGRSLSTVQSHARAIYLKLGVHNRTEAVFEARQLRLLS